MYATRLFGQDDIRYVEVETPVLQDGEVLVQMQATGICGSDIPRVLGTAAHHYPITLGHEFSGIVKKVGQSVTKVAVDDYVAGVPLLPCKTCEYCQRGFFAQCPHYSFIGSRKDGSWAEYVVMPEENLLKFDEDIPFEHAAFIEPAAVALHALRQIRFESGHSVVVIGAGTIGLLIVQWLAAFGASQITVIDIDDARLKLAQQCGADKVVNSSVESLQSIENQYHYVFEAAGSVVTIRHAFNLVKPHGYVCLVGTPTTEVVFTHQQFELINRKEFMLTGSWMSYSAPFPGEEWTTTLAFMKKKAFQFDLMIDKKLPLAQVNEAFQLYKDKKVKGKIMFVP